MFTDLDKFQFEMIEKFKEDARNYSIPQLLEMYDVNLDALNYWFKKFGVSLLDENKIREDKLMYQASLEERIEMLQNEIEKMKTCQDEIFKLQNNILNKSRLLNILENITTENYELFTKEENCEFHAKPCVVEGIENLFLEYVRKVYGENKERLVRDLLGDK